MKDNLSIIFATIILAFLLIILPLFSIVDRQDTMAYNVVLTKTTNFVDEIRSNGFLTLDAYHDYIEALHSTGNTYNVTLQAYNKILIPDEVDGSGNVLSYREEKQLYNTKDIQNFLEGNKQNDEINNSNVKENIYLFDVNDEIYVSVYNTNLTAGDMMYSIFMNSVQPKSIDITYGGAVKEVNWELYNKLYKTQNNSPEVVLSLPINGNDSINVQKIVDNSNPVEITCAVKTNDIFSVVYELCKDIESGPHYAYIYNLDKEENRTIKIAVAINNADLIDVGEGEDKYKTVEDIRAALDRETYEEYIKENYIRLVGMTADIEVKFDIEANRQTNQAFDIILTNVSMTSTANISSLASIVVLDGLAKNASEETSGAVESEKVHLIKDSTLLATQITGPYNWPKFLKTKNFEESLLEESKVYKSKDTGTVQEIFFKVHYRGIKNKTPEEVKDLIKDKLNFENYNKAQLDAGEKIVTLYTPQEFYRTFGIRTEVDTIIVKLNQKIRFERTANYIELSEEWDGNKMPGYQKNFEIAVDSVAPGKPVVLSDGEYNYNTGWYTSDVTITIKNSDKGSGILRNTLYVKQGDNGNYEQREVEKQYLLTQDGEYTLKAISTDYVGYVSDESEILSLKMDKTPPKAPTIDITGTKVEEWYTSDVTIKVKEVYGADNGSGVLKTTVELRGPINFSEQTVTDFYKEYKVTQPGVYTVIAKTYDNAGNVSQTIKQIKIDKSEPPYVSFNILQGTTNQNLWDEYVTNHEEFWCLDSTDRYYEKAFCNNPTITGNFSWFSTAIKLRINVQLISEKHSDTSEYKLLRRDSYAGYTEEIASGSFKGTLKELVIGQKVDGTGNIIGIADGVYKLEVTTSTIGNKKATESVYFNIDSHAPNAPEVSINGTRGKDPLKETDAKALDWYVSDVNISITKKGDQEVAYKNSGEATGVTGGTYRLIKYKYINGNYTLDGEGKYIEVANNQYTLSDNNTIKITEDGAYKLQITTKDNAGNQNVYEEEFKIDKTNPTPAVIHTGERSIKGNTEKIIVDKEDVVGSWVQDSETGEWILVKDSTGTIEVIKQWYLSDIFIGYKDQADEISGIAKVEVEFEVSDLTISDEINTEVSGLTIAKEINTKEITFTTYDYAGNKSISKAYVGLDKTKPTAPILNMPVSVNDTVEGVFVYNKNEACSITEGTDELSGYDKTTYVITKKTKNGVDWAEDDDKNFTLSVESGEQANFTLSVESGEQANFTIEARTYDKAGNYSIATEVALMSRVKPNTPTILSVNGDNSNSTCSRAKNMMVWIGLEKADKRNTLVISEDSILSADDTRIVASDKEQYYEKSVGFATTPVTVYIWQIDMYMNKSDWVTASYHYCYDDNYGL